MLPSLVILERVLLLGRRFQIGRLNPLYNGVKELINDRERSAIATTTLLTNLENKPATTRDGRMLQRLDHGNVRVLEVSVLADEHDAHFIVETGVTLGNLAPLVEEGRAPAVIVTHGRVRTNTQHT